jgi:hypothetical protein
MSIRKKIIIILCAAGIHFVFTLQCISKVSIGGDGITPDKFWLRALDVAAFPLLYLQKVEYHFGDLIVFGFDLLPLLTICNSILCGFLFLWVILSVRRKLSRTQSN